VEQVLLAMAAAISRHEMVLFLVPPAGFATPAPAATIARLGGDLRRIDWIPLATNDLWVRDYGPLTVFEGNEIRLVDFRFNGWGGKYSYADDDLVTKRLSERGSWGEALVESSPEILEGGSRETDGQGTVLTTRRCLLNPNRGARDEEGIEALLGQTLGAHRVLWLDTEALPGDDTDAHIDTLVRFASPRVLIYQGGVGHPDARVRQALESLSRELASLKGAHGSPYTRIELPSPGRIVDSEDRPLPATYANFLILNDALLIPQYGVDADRWAAELLSKAFPARHPYPIDARPLIAQYGSLHCASLQLARGTIPESPDGHLAIMKEKSPSPTPAAPGSPEDPK
jgi:agmatine/peptidylarginine deiminase